MLSGTLLGIVLAAARCFAILRAQPHWAQMVGPWWWAVAAAMGAALGPVLAVGASVPDMSIAAAGVALVLELGLGTAMGLFIALPAHGLIGSASLSGMTLGLKGHSGRVWTGLVVAFVMAATLSLGLHRPSLGAMVSIGDLWPIGRPQHWLWSLEGGTEDVVRGAASATVLALSLATPVLLTAALADIALGLLGAGPAGSDRITSALAPWLRTAAALIALGASWAVYPHVWSQAIS